MRATARVLLGSVGWALMHDSSRAILVGARPATRRAETGRAAGAAAAGHKRRRRQAAVGVIVTVSLVASLGSGIVTSTTPSCVLALMLLASTPEGSVIERLKDP